MSDQIIQIKGLTVNYKTFGEGEPLLVLHGWGGSSESYLQLKDYLQDSFKLYIPDLPGFGKSEPPKEVWDVSRYMEFANDFATEIGLDKFLFFGHSFGGRVCIKFLNKYPEKVKALILCASAGIKHELTTKQKAGKAVSKIGKKVFKLPGVNKLEKVARKILYKSIGEHDYEKLSSTMKESFKKVIAEDLQPLIKNIKVPTLIVWGKQDGMTPLSDAYIFEKEIEGSKLKVIDEARHGVHKQAPEKLGSYIKEFIKSL